MAKSKSDVTDDTVNTGEMPEVTKAEKKPKGNSFIYIGPTLPGGRLKKNTVFRGSYDAVMDALAYAISAYPQIKRLVVPTISLSGYKNNIESGGNVTSNAYRELSAAFLSKKEE